MKKTVLITGCSSGFGYQMVPLFLKNGWQVIATLRRATERASLFESEKNDFKDLLQVLELDVTQAKDRNAVLELIQTRYEGNLDCLINNAGYGLFGALEDISEEQLRDQMEVNFFGTALLTRALLPPLRAARGRIINLSSVFGFSGFPLTGGYCASKYAVEGLSEALRLELAPLGVQVSLVEPGGHRTRFAESVAWGERSFSKDSAYYTATEGYRAFRDHLAQRPNPQVADTVAQEILRLATASRMPARVVCGKDAKMMSILKQKRMGAKIAEFVLGTLYRRRFLSWSQPS